MKSISILPRQAVYAVALALVVAACSTAPRAPGNDAPPPPETMTPSTTAPPDQIGAPGGSPSAPADLETVPAPEPDVGRWGKPGVSSAAYQADVDTCFAYAQAQIAHDRRIERDSTAAFETFPDGTNLPQLRDRMNEFERGNRRIDLFDDCMESKGYAPK